MEFDAELDRVLPPDIPNRECLIRKAARHLQLIAAANETMNLTRIMSPHEAAIKHVYDSVAPWRFFSDAARVIDVGTGAGFPGIPLSIVLPGVQFLLIESVQKKARFVDAAADELDLHNVRVIPERAETVSPNSHVALFTARAVAPITRLVPLFGRAFKRGARMLLYKGPDVESELAEAAPELKRLRITGEVLHRYELPGQLGARTLVALESPVRGRPLSASAGMV
ncbi:MAG TPA: 16S rRNA (guanine(527)-N(7))-methyltransferase RsmG [Bryobacteraceae bacterium]|nr:16S rRNA (guanine(527)-N(7))-methyltransferase RsmG [Bryobacteraceae bacterium]